VYVIYDVRGQQMSNNSVQRDSASVLMRLARPVARRGAVTADYCSRRQMLLSTARYTSQAAHNGGKVSGETLPEIVNRIAASALIEHDWGRLQALGVTGVICQLKHSSYWKR